MALSSETWQTVERAVANKCAAHDFVLDKDMSEPHSFGSRYVEFGRGQARIRLVWDGKEEWFLVEWNRAKNTQRPWAGWKDIVLIRCAGKDPNADTEAVVDEIVTSLGTFLEFGERTSG